MNSMTQSDNRPRHDSDGKSTDACTTPSQGLTNKMCETVFATIGILAVFLAGLIMSYLAMSISIIGIDRDRNARLNFRFGFAALVMAYQPVVLSVMNIVLFTLRDAGVELPKRIPRTFYAPEISLFFCLIFLGGAVLSFVIGMFFFFKVVDVSMIYTTIGLIVLSGVGYGPVWVSLVLLYKYTSKHWSYY